MRFRGHGRQWWVVGGLVALGVATLVLGKFLSGQHLAKADQWASVLSLFLTIGGLLIAVYGVVLDRRSARPDAQSQSTNAVRNQVRGATEATGTVLMARDIDSLNLT